MTLRSSGLQLNVGSATNVGLMVSLYYNYGNDTPRGGRAKRAE